MHKMQSKIIFFLLVAVTNIEVAKITTSFLSYFVLVKNILRYNNLSNPSFNIWLGLGLT